MIFKKLLDVVLWCVGKIANLLLFPIFQLINAGVPQVQAFFDGINSFLDWFLPAIPIAIDTLMIPRSILSLWFTWLIAKFSFYLVLRAFNFSVKMWQKFKPT